MLYIIVTLIFNLLLSSQPFAHAQPQQHFTPTVVSAPAFARTINKLYIAGGAWAVHPDIRSQQFISLDLLVPFTSAAPAWTRLADGPLQRLFPAAFSSDEKTLYVFHIDGTNSPWRYSVQEDSWQEVTAAKFQNSMWEGIGAVTDPSTGLIYLAGGYDDISAKTKALKVLNTFDPVSMTIHRDDLPAPDRAFPERWYYGNVWSRNRSSVIYWGGNNRAPDQQLSPVENGVTELQPSSMGWYTFPMQGVPPTVRAYHCMAANEGGTKIVIYGGQLRNTTIVGELWILDLVQFTWTQGLSGPSRMYAACTIVDDQFLLWGGSIAQNMVAPAEMVIYNLTSSQYVTQYTPPSWYKDQVPPPALSRTTAPWATDGQALPSSGIGKAGVSGAIAGGVIGGMAFVGLVAGMFFMRLRRQQLRQGQGEEAKGQELRAERNGAGKGLLLVGRAGPGDGDDRLNGQEVLGRGETWKNDPQCSATTGHGPQATEQFVTNAVDRSLQELVEQQRELEQKRQLLVLKHQGLATSDSEASLGQHQHHQQHQPVRAPAFFAGAKTEYLSPPPPTPASIPLPPSTPISSESFYTDILLSTASLTSKPTVHALTGSQGDYFTSVTGAGASDGYVDGYEGARPSTGGRRESERAQASIDESFGSIGSGLVQGALGERRESGSCSGNGSGGGIGMYADVATDWIQQQQQQLHQTQQAPVHHPHTSADPVFIQYPK